MAHAVGSGLLGEGLEPGSKTIVGIYSANRVEVRGPTSPGTHGASITLTPGTGQGKTATP